MNSLGFEGSTVGVRGDRFSFAKREAAALGTGSASRQDSGGERANLSFETFKCKLSLSYPDDPRLSRFRFRLLKAMCAERTS